MNASVVWDRGGDSINIFWLIYLTYIGVYDIKTRTLTLQSIIFGVILVCIEWYIEPRFNVTALVTMLIGGIFLLVSKCTDEKLGYGDSIVILMLSTVLSLIELLSVLWIASTLCAITGILLIMSKHKVQSEGLPFLAYIAFGYGGFMLWW